MRKIPKNYYRATPIEIEAIRRSADTLSGIIGVGSDFDPEARKIVKHIDKFLKRNGLERDFK